jgi:hypothetical protein
MSARKLGRFAGLVFVLAAVFGGIGIAGTAHDSQASTAATATVQSSQLSIEWD